MIKLFCRVAIIVLYSISLGIYIAKDGQPKEGEYKASSAIIAAIIIFSLFYGAGMFE